MKNYDDVMNVWIPHRVVLVVATILLMVLLVVLVVFAGSEGDASNPGEADADEAPLPAAAELERADVLERRLACLEAQLGVSPPGARYGDSGGDAFRDRAMRIFFLEGYLDVQPSPRSIDMRHRLGRVFGAASRTGFAVEPCLRSPG